MVAHYDSDIWIVSQLSWSLNSLITHDKHVVNPYKMLFYLWKFYKQYIYNPKATLSAFMSILILLAHVPYYMQFFSFISRLPSITAYHQDKYSHWQLFSIIVNSYKYMRTCQSQSHAFRLPSHICLSSSDIHNLIHIYKTRMPQCLQSKFFEMTFPDFCEVFCVIHYFSK